MIISGLKFLIIPTNRGITLKMSAVLLAPRLSTIIPELTFSCSPSTSGISVTIRETNLSEGRLLTNLSSLFSVPPYVRPLIIFKILILFKLAISKAPFFLTVYNSIFQFYPSLYLYRAFPGFSSGHFYLIPGLFPGCRTIR